MRTAFRHQPPDLRKPVSSGKFCWRVLGCAAFGCVASLLFPLAAAAQPQNPPTWQSLPPLSHYGPSNTLGSPPPATPAIAPSYRQLVTTQPTTTQPTTTRPTTPQPTRNQPVLGQQPNAHWHPTGPQIAGHQMAGAQIPNSQPQNSVSIPRIFQTGSGLQQVPAGFAAMQSLLEDDADGDDLLGDDLLDGDELLDNDLLGGDSDSGGLDSMGPIGGAGNIPGAGHGTDKPSRGGVPDGLDPHAEAFAENQYPSAATCAKCHQKIYDEWRVSAHAYAAISPMFQKFEQKLQELSNGTLGTFCMRCHAPIATQLNFPRELSIVDAPYVYREGITCVACHRVKQPFGRVHGERRVEPGPLQAPVYGSVGGDGVAQAIANKDEFKIKLDPNSKEPGQEIHWEGIKFEQLSQSGFCQPCHQVAVHPGVSLEIVWAQYRAGPACKKGISCQDCHMGAVPGKAEGYTFGAAADMSGKSVNNFRKHSNHIFHGPGNPIAHPGLFPHNPKSLRWTIDQWLQFNWRDGWGTDAFEKALADKKIFAAFPADWDSADERRDARKVLDENFKLLDYKKANSIATMEAGSRLQGPYFKDAPRLGDDLKFNFKVSNNSEGHNNPSGSLGAQPQLWLNVVLTGPSGQWLWESGYLDANGDLANQHSTQVHQRQIAPDYQLFNLQTQFLITGVKGPDREMYLPVNLDIDQLAFLRPGATPFTTQNHPPFIRMEAKSIPPLGHKIARYKVPGHLLRQPGTYRITARLRSRMEPIYFMRFVGSTPEMERRMLEQTIDLHPYTVEFNVY